MPRFAFYVDVGDMPPSMVMEQIHRIRERMKERAPSMEEDTFFIPVRSGDTRVDVLVCPACQQPHKEGAAKLLSVFTEMKVDWQKEMDAATTPEQRKRLEDLRAFLEDAKGS